MHRSIARFLLLVALVGNLGPIVAAAVVAPPHACCLRKAAHPCHESLAAELASELARETGQLLLRDASCCNHDCGGAVVTLQCAHTQTSACTTFVPAIEAYEPTLTPASSTTELGSFQSTRAPPLFPLA